MTILKCTQWTSQLYNHNEGDNTHLLIAQSTRKNSHKVLEQNIQQLELAEEMLNSETKELNLFAKKKKNEVFTKKKTYLSMKQESNSKFSIICSLTTVKLNMWAT